MGGGGGGGGLNNYTENDNMSIYYVQSAFQWVILLWVSAGYNIENAPERILDISGKSPNHLNSLSSTR